ncbi:hypothetical protein CR513_39937, partial [Mucuna pruriens]
MDHIISARRTIGEVEHVSVPNWNYISQMFGLLLFQAHSFILEAETSCAIDFLWTILGKTTNNSNYRQKNDIGSRIYKGCLEHNGVTDYAIADLQ